MTIEQMIQNVRENPAHLPALCYGETHAGNRLNVATFWQRAAAHLSESEYEDLFFAWLQIYDESKGDDADA